ncbi:MAG: hypothetical protein AAFN81_34990, partial [Bacteroidota bacterium]
MIRTISICIILFVSISTSAQQLESVYQGNARTIFSQQACGTNPCDDLDPSTFDACLDNQCVYSTFSGIPPARPYGLMTMRVHPNGELWSFSGYATQYDGTSARTYSYQSAGWPNQWQAGAIAPLPGFNGAVWFVGTENLAGPVPAVGSWDGNQMISYTNNSGYLAPGGILDVVNTPSGGLSILHDSRMITNYDGSNWTTIDLNQYPSLAGFSLNRLDYAPNGDLWLIGANNSPNPASWATLAKFDGTSWTVYPTNITVNTFWLRMLVDRNGKVWFHEQPNQLHSIDGNGALLTYSNATGSLPAGPVTSISEGANDQLWVALAWGGIA